MIAAHQQITDETGQTFILLPLEEYNALLGLHPDENEELSAEEANAIQEGLTEIENGETVSAQEVAAQLGLSLNASVLRS
jgi:PHD/YefM family antitoxin component YafN of YafNO toxin-antitoxin module